MGEDLGDTLASSRKRLPYSVDDVILWTRPEETVWLTKGLSPCD